MKLVRFDGGRLGIAVAEAVVDVSDLSPVPVQVWPPVAMVSLISRFDDLRPALAEAVRTRPRLALESVRLDTPLVWPHKLFGIPANYHAHIAEMASRNRADVNGFFLKAASSLSGPSDPIVLPDLPGREVHHESELGIVIGRRGRDIPVETALEHVFGYTCLIDVVVRGTEERVMRKSFDTFCPIGPWLVTSDEVGDPCSLDIELLVNSEPRQRANTRDMILGIREMISMISAVTTLEPGDLIASGTPAGVGPLADGDVVDIAIEDVGSMQVGVERGRSGSNVAFRNAEAARA